MEGSKVILNREILFLVIPKLSQHNMLTKHSLFAFIAFITLSLLPYVNCLEQWEGGAIGGGIGGLIILILDVIAIFEILNGGAGIATKLLWILFILFFPILGFIIYWYDLLSFILTTKLLW